MSHNLTLISPCVAPRQPVFFSNFLHAEFLRPIAPYRNETSSLFNTHSPDNSTGIESKPAIPREGFQEALILGYQSTLTLTHEVCKSPNRKSACAGHKLQQTHALLIVDLLHKLHTNKQIKSKSSYFCSLRICVNNV